MSGRNVFENNERPEDEDFIKSIAGENPHVRLPALKDGFAYEIQKLPSGESAVIITGEAEVEEPSCGCAPYQGCAKCGRYQADGLDSPESRTLRHSDQGTHPERWEEQPFSG